MSMHKWPSIESLKHVIKYACKYTDVKALTFRPKVKLHGTNAAIQFHAGGTVVAQSRSRIITPEDDNMGFATWVSEQTWTTPGSCTVFGEWFGRGIMKGTSASAVDGRHFAAFGVYLHETEKWLCAPEAIQEVYPGLVLPWAGEPLVIDFSAPEASRTLIEQALHEVEQEDPWIKETFGVSGNGEGLVYYPFVPSGEFDPSFLFKTKGEKHKVKSTKQKVEIDPEVVASGEAFASTYVTPARFEQCLAELGIDDVEPKDMGRVLKWMLTDVQKESETDLEEAGLTWSQVQKYVAAAVRRAVLDA